MYIDGRTCKIPAEDTSHLHNCPRRHRLRGAKYNFLEILDHSSYINEKSLKHWYCVWVVIFMLCSVVNPLFLHSQFLLPVKIKWRTTCKGAEVHLTQSTCNHRANITNMLGDDIHALLFCFRGLNNLLKCRYHCCPCLALLSLSCLHQDQCCPYIAGVQPPDGRTAKCDKFSLYIERLFAHVKGSQITRLAENIHYCA